MIVRSMIPSLHHYICISILALPDVLSIIIVLCALPIMSFTFPRAGGPWLVTDMDRIESIFEIQPALQVMLWFRDAILYEAVV